MKILVWSIREKKGWSVRKLAQKSGVPHSTVSNIENGKYSPTMHNIEKLAKALGEHIENLYESDYK